MPTAPRFWRSRRHPLVFLLRPLAVLFCGVAALRRRYQAARAGCGGERPPVVVVGSIFVGGTGKTPLVVALAEIAAADGLRPGVVLRGYGGRNRGAPQLVDAASDPRLVGDEAVLLARRTGVPVAAGADRRAGVRLLGELGCDLVIADDGLQHYRMPRAAEIVVLDRRGLGNGLCLPAGPLREPPERLREVDQVIGNGAPIAGVADYFELRAGAPVPASDQAPMRLPGGSVHAVAGIGAPERFFDMLTALGYEVCRHPYPDHHAFRRHELVFDDDRDVLMTEKDAVKCAHWAPRNSYFIPVTAVLASATEQRLRQLLRRASRAEPRTDG